MKQIWKVDLLYFRCILFVACFSNFATSVDDTRFNVIGKHILCAHSKDQLVESSLCNVKLLNRTSNLYNASLVLHPNITLHNAYVEFSTYHRFRIVYRPIVVKFQVDLCARIQAARNNIEPMPPYGCPFKGHLFIEDWELRYHGQDLSIFNEGEWRVDARFFTRQLERDVAIITIQHFVEIKQIRAR